MANQQQIDALTELYRRKALNPDQMAAVEELARRGVLQLDATAQPEEALRQQAGDLPDPQEIARQDAYKSVAEEVGPIEAGIIGLGRGFTTVGRGLGLIDPEDESEKQAYQALKDHRPYSTGAGEIVGEAAPFVALGGAGGLAARTVLPKLGSAGATALAATETLGGRVATTGTLGALEGGTIAAGKGESVEEGALIGALFGAGSEIVVPAVGRLVKSLYRKYKGIPPEGALLDATGQPTPELRQALEEQQLSFEDLTQGAQDVITQQRAGAVPEQVARQAEFEEAGVRATRGEITQLHDDQAMEARLLQSSRDELAEPFRQYKLSQSEEIKGYLSNGLSDDVIEEETGILIFDALSGRKNLLRTERNELYKEFRGQVEGAENLPIFTNAISDSLPDPKELRRLSITAGEPIKELNETLMEYGVIEPSEEFLKKGIEPEILNAANFDDFRQIINQIEKKAKRSGQEAALVATSPIKRALDAEVNEMAVHLEELGFGEEVLRPLREGRKRVRTLKTEFSAQSEAGSLLKLANDGFTVMNKASKVYSNKIAMRSVPVENVRGIMNSLKKSGAKGEAAISSLQTTTMLDIINAGFSTESRKVNGIKIFNPGAFKKRMESIGQPKLKAIFADNPAMINRLNNIDKISETLIRSGDAEPKGSSSTILDIFDKFGMSFITSKVPGIGPAFNEFLTKTLQSQRTRADVNQAIMGNPEITRFVNVLDKTYPGIVSALGIATTDVVSERMNNE